MFGLFKNKNTNNKIKELTLVPFNESKFISESLDWAWYYLQEIFPDEESTPKEVETLMDFINFVGGLFEGKGEEEYLSLNSLVGLTHKYLGDRSQYGADVQANIIRYVDEQVGLSKEKVASLNSPYLAITYLKIMNSCIGYDGIIENERLRIIATVIDACQGIFDIDTHKTSKDGKIVSIYEANNTTFNSSVMDVVKHVVELHFSTGKEIPKHMIDDLAKV